MSVLNVVNIDQCGCAAGCCYVEVILPRVLLPGKRRVGVAGLWRRNNCLLLIFFVTVLCRVDWCSVYYSTPGTLLFLSAFQKAKSKYLP